jgi:CheY-like chemotaxis protein
MKINKVMVVDDDHSIRTIAEISLSDVGGYQVVLIGSANEALSRVESEMPDVILMDVRMPEMDGPTLISRIRQNQKVAHIPVILMSASISDDERTEYASLGAAGVFWKPFDAMKLPLELQAAVENL